MRPGLLLSLGVTRCSQGSLGAERVTESAGSQLRGLERVAAPLKHQVSSLFSGRG